MLGLATDDVEQLCSLLILDETLHGWLDQVGAPPTLGCLVETS